MRFASKLLRGHLIRRYKRFLCDVELDDGRTVTAHCANPGAMLGLNEPGSVVWLSPADNPKRKLKFSWELLEVDLGNGPGLVGINTSHPNRLVEEAINVGAIAELTGYSSLRREVRYGENSRIDILLEADGRPPCYVEVKNVHLMRQPGLAEFPDSVTARGAKHLRELANMADQGMRAVMFYLIQREDARSFALAGEIDPAYTDAFAKARAHGVEALSYCCKLSVTEIQVANRVDHSL